MPWPFLPPNPDTFPAPHDGELFVFSLTLTGMRPYDEQADHSFLVDQATASVYMPIVESPTAYKYRGICMAALPRVGTTATYKGTYVPLGKSNTHDVAVDARQLTGGITSVAVQRSGSKAIFTVGVDTGGTSGLSVVAAPYMPTALRFASESAYMAAGDIEAVPTASTTVKLTVTAGSLTHYGVFLASGLPSSINPRSAGRLVKI
ncbi:MAG: hypothetical protein KC549_04530 [Myxococcales bacterium]|nr:hypothetical protein [Myxococcales bacterium]MCB9549622.1 hypothetical protein [Myxococcales bacterium]